MACRRRPRALGLDDAAGRRITRYTPRSRSGVGTPPSAKRRSDGSVGVAREQDGVARGAVAPGAADHLHVALERVREVDERDESYVGLVDAHPERGRRDDDRDVSRDERVLDARPLVRFETGVVVLGPDPVAAERARDLLARAPGARVDDRSASVDRAEATEHAAQPLLGVLGVLDVVAEVRPVDARAHDLEPPPERLRDRVRVRGRGRRGHPEHGRRAELVERPADEEVVGPEVVTPHADAVHLVDHDEPDADAAQRAHEGLLPKALGRGVEDPGPAGGDPSRRAAASPASSEELTNVAVAAISGGSLST